jgi:hypothetical protein
MFRDHAEHVPDHPLWMVDSALLGVIRKSFGCLGDQKSSGSRKVRRRRQRTHQSDWIREQTRFAAHPLRPAFHDRGLRVLPAPLRELPMMRAHHDIRLLRAAPVEVDL